MKYDINVLPEARSSRRREALPLDSANARSATRPACKSAPRELPVTFSNAKTNAALLPVRRGQRRQRPPRLPRSWRQRPRGAAPPRRRQLRQPWRSPRAPCRDERGTFQGGTFQRRTFQRRSFQGRTFQRRSQEQRRPQEQRRSLQEERLRKVRGVEQHHDHPARSHDTTRHDKTRRHKKTRQDTTTRKKKNDERTGTRRVVSYNPAK